MSDIGALLRELDAVAATAEPGVSSIVEAVGRRSNVLRIGAHGGPLARRLHENECQLLEIETPVIHRSPNLPRGGLFDVVLLDGISASAHPLDLLLGVRELIDVSGRIIVSFYNSPHAVLRTSLLNGDGRGETISLPDAERLFDEAGLRVARSAQVPYPADALAATERFAGTLGDDAAREALWQLGFTPLAIVLVSERGEEGPASGRDAEIASLRRFVKQRDADASATEAELAAFAVEFAMLCDRIDAFTGELGGSAAIEPSLGALPARLRSSIERLEASGMRNQHASLTAQVTRLEERVTALKAERREIAMAYRELERQFMRQSRSIVMRLRDEMNEMHGLVSEIHHSPLWRVKLVAGNILASVRRLRRRS